jgi:hypothetical protein
MRRRRLLVALGAVLLAVAVAALLLPRPGVTRSNFDRIKKGMPRGEVERILGGPPSESGIAVAPRVPWAIWTQGGTTVLVLFDEDAVEKCDFYEHPPPSLADRVRGWLRRLWP